MARTHTPGREAQHSGSLVEAIEGLTQAVTLLAERLGPSQPTPPPLGGRGRHLRVAPPPGYGDTPWDRLSVPELRALLGEARFFSATYRLFQIPELEDACEDHGQAACYLGSIEGLPDGLDFDKHHRFDTGRVVSVCGNTWRMLAESRLAPHFSLMGDFSRHFGLFAGCGAAMPFSGSCC